jgi:hypothetical protein
LASRRARGNPVPEPVVRRMQHGAELAERLEEFASQTPADVAETEEDDARLVLKIRGTTRLTNGPFARLRFTPLGEGEDWTYYVLSSRESRELLISVLSEYAGLPDGMAKDVSWDHPKSWAEFLDHIDGIELYGPGDRADPTLAELVFDPVDTIDCLLWPAGNERIAAHRVNEVIGNVSGHAATEPRVNVVAVDPRPDRTLVRIVATEALINELLNNVDVERIRAPLRATVTQSELTTANMPDHIPEPATTVIGVVDGIINIANPLTGPFVAAAEAFPTGHVFGGADEHGTAVAGTAVWGDLDQLVIAGSLSAPHPVVSARVLDITPANDYGVTGMAHTTIENAIRWLVADHAVRIVNLSINYPVAANSALRDELTVTIDTLARELGIVIVVSAGNRLQLPQGNWLTDYPGYLADTDAKVAAPGDAALAVTVGSHAVRDVPGGPYASSKVAIAAAQQPSPFTRSGPVRGIGRVGTLKPEFTHHGGNWSWDHMTRSLDTLEPGTAAVVAIPPRAGRIVGSSTGTSYAAPAVAHEIARIAERYPIAGANLLRALTALSARPTQGTVAGIDPLHIGGYGQPEASRVLESGPHRVFLTYEGIALTNRVLVHRLPIPAEFADGVRQRTFRVALAFDPPVRRGRREYIAGTMSVELIRGVSLQDVQEIYARQPTVAAAAQNAALVRRELPGDDHRPPMNPGLTTIGSNTLIRREFLNGVWDPDHGDYFLIVMHNQSAWTAAQRSSYAEQPYALAVEIAEETESSLDLYAAVRARLRGRARLR